MKPPDDGKKYGWFVDTRRCFGCHGCEVSCKAENDVPLGHFIRQTFYKDVGEYPKVARGCSCRWRASIAKTLRASRRVPAVRCIKSRAARSQSTTTSAAAMATCVDVCPYGAIYMDPVAKQAVKCHNCYHRTENGMEPACVPTCPSEALYFGDLNDPESKINKAMARRASGGRRTDSAAPGKEHEAADVVCRASTGRGRRRHSPRRRVVQPRRLQHLQLERRSPTSNTTALHPCEVPHERRRRIPPQVSATGPGRRRHVGADRHHRL